MQKPDSTERAPRILRLRDVCARTGLSRSAIYSRVVAGAFPQRVSLGARAVGWHESAVEDWIAARVPAPQPAPPEATRAAAQKRAQRAAAP